MDREHEGTVAQRDQVVTVGAAVLDIGGTYVRSTVVDANGASHELRKIEAPNFLREGRRSAAELREELVNVVERCVMDAAEDAGLEPPLCVGISFPGPVDRAGTVLSAPTLWGPEAEAFPLGPRVRDRLRTPHVFVMNDMTAATWYYSEKTDARRFCMVTVSSGIGNKVFDRDHPDGVLLLEDGVGGEIGHVTVDESADAPRCDCGGKGHLGGIASGRGVERLARRRAAAEKHLYPESPVLAAVTDGGRPITNEEHLVPAIRAGDRFATRVLREATRPLVRCLATVGVSIGIEQFVFVGGFALSIGAPYLRIVRALWDEQASYYMIRDRPENFFVLGHDGEMAALIGVGQFALRRCEAASG